MLSPVCATAARPQLVPFSPSPPQVAAQVAAEVAVQAVLAVVGAVAVVPPVVVMAVIVVKSSGAS
jgi:NAD-dependent SIR2 family protein deacetylase